MSENVYTRLAKARAEFQKKADFSKVKTDGLKYAYLPIEQAKPLIEEVTAEQGITILPYDLHIIEGVERTYHYNKESPYDKKITKWSFITAKIDFIIAGPELDTIEMSITAEAQDNSDKCISKLYTAGYKNLVKIVFGFAENAKDDADASQEEVAFVPGNVYVPPAVKETPEDRKNAEQKAREKSLENAEKGKIIEQIRWKVAIDPDKADVLRDRLQEEFNYEGSNEPNELAKALNKYLDKEQLNKLSSDLDVVA